MEDQSLISHLLNSSSTIFSFPFHFVRIEDIVTQEEILNNTSRRISLYPLGRWVLSVILKSRESRDFPLCVSRRMWLSPLWISSISLSFYKKNMKKCEKFVLSFKVKVCREEFLWHQKVRKKGWSDIFQINNDGTGKNKFCLLLLHLAYFYINKFRAGTYVLT